MCRRNEAVTAAKSFFSVQLSTVLLLLVLLSLLYFLSSIKYVSGAHGGLRMEWRHWSTTALASWAARRRRSSCWRAAAAGAFKVWEELVNVFRKDGADPADVFVHCKKVCRPVTTFLHCKMVQHAGKNIRDMFLVLY
jgi:hypothetical protein